MIVTCSPSTEIKIRALRADVPLFPESLTRKKYRKKVPENAIKVPGVPGKFPKKFYFFSEALLIEN